MANAKEIKRKIKSVKNTGKITKAMELISTVKMKKAQDLAMEKKEFVLEVLKVLLRIDSSMEDFPLFEKEKPGRTLGVIITSNKGLCGGYNINVMKEVNTYIQETGETIDFVTLGKRGSLFVAKTGNNIVADFSDDFTDNLDPYLTKKISRYIMNEFLTPQYGKVVIFYNHYINTIAQKAVSEEFLPIEKQDIIAHLKDIGSKHFDLEDEIKQLEESELTYEIEPSQEEIAHEVMPMILDMMFHDILLEAKASEHSARMIAMKNAKDSAKKISDRLTLIYNKARQAAITAEVSEITAGVESMKEV